MLYGLTRLHRSRLRYLHEEAGCDPHASNSYGCNAAMWAAQAGELEVCRYLRSLGVAFDLRNATAQGTLRLSRSVDTIERSDSDG